MEKLKLILRRSPQKEGVFFCSSSSNGCDLNASSSVTTKLGLSQRRYRRSIAALQSTSAISGSATQSSSVAASDENENPSVRPCSRASAGGGDTGRVVKTNLTALRRQNPNRCSYCPFVSMDRMEVKEHVRTEHQIKCMKCWMTFESREERQEHMLTNHSENGFYCEDCNMMFRQRKFLNDHLATLKHKSMESFHLRFLAELVKTLNLPIALPSQVMDHPFRGEHAKIQSSMALSVIGGPMKRQHAEAPITAPPLKRARGDTVNQSAANSSEPNNAKLPSEQQGPSLSMMQQPSSSTQQQDPGSCGWDEVAAYIPNCEADNSSGAAESGKVGAVKRIYDYLTCDAPEANGVSSMASANAPSVVSFNQFASYPPPTESSMQTSEFANAGAASGNMSMDYWNGYTQPHHHSYNNSFVYYPQQTSYWSNSMQSTDQHYDFQQYPSSQLQASNCSSFQAEQQAFVMGPFNTCSCSTQEDAVGFGGKEIAYATSSQVNFNPSDYQVPINNTTIEPLPMQPTETRESGTNTDAVVEIVAATKGYRRCDICDGNVPVDQWDAHLSGSTHKRHLCGPSQDVSSRPVKSRPMTSNANVDVNGGRTTCDPVLNAGGVVSETCAILGNEIGDAGSSRENASVSGLMATRLFIKELTRKFTSASVELLLKAAGIVSAFTVSKPPKSTFAFVTFESSADAAEALRLCLDKASSYFGVLLSGVLNFTAKMALSMGYFDLQGNKSWFMQR